MVHIVFQQSLHIVPTVDLIHNRLALTILIVALSLVDSMVKAVDRGCCVAQCGVGVEQGVCLGDGKGFVGAMGSSAVSNLYPIQTNDF